MGFRSPKVVKSSDGLRYGDSLVICTNDGTKGRVSCARVRYKATADAEKSRETTPVDYCYLLSCTRKRIVDAVAPRLGVGVGLNIQAGNAP